MAKTTMKDVQQLTNAADEAARKAAEAVRPAHDAAVQAAVELRDELAVNTSERERVRKLVEIIEAGTAKRKTGKDAASTTFQQYITSVTTTREVSSSKQRDGIHWIATFRTYSHDWAREQRQAIVDALVMACAGKITAGLTTFPSSLADGLNLDVAQDMAKVSDPDAFAQYQASQAALADELSQAQRYVDALEQTRPHLAVTDLDQSGGVAIRNHRPGDVSVGGIKFRGGTVTEISSDDFAKVRDHRMFNSHIEAGVLELTSTAPMAQAV